MGGKTVNGPSVWKAKAVMENMFPSAIPGERAALLVSPRSHSLRAAMLRFAEGPAARCRTSLRHPGFTMIGLKKLLTSLTQNNINRPPKTITND